MLDSSAPPVETLILKGLLQNIGHVFNVDSPFLLSTTDRFHIADIVSKQRGETSIKYPLAFLHLTGIDDWEQGNSYNTGALLRYGGYTEVIQNSSHKISLLPVRFDLELIFLTDDYVSALRLMNIWKFAGRKGKLNSTIVYGGLNLDVKTFLDTNLSSPDKDNTVDMVNVYEYSGQVHVNGYMSSVDADDTREVPMISTLTKTVVGS